MQQNNRVQLSLFFQDDDLFKGLVIPYRESADRSALNRLVMKLLGAYYYKPEVRSLVDAETEEVKTINDFEETLNNMRNNLAMQSFMADEMLNSSKAAMGNIENAMNQGVDEAPTTNAQNPTQQSANVVAIPKFEETQPVKSQEVQQPQSEGKSAEFNLLAQILQNMLVKQGDTQDAELLAAYLNPKTTSNPQSVEKTGRQIEDDEILSNVIQSEPVSEPVKEEVQEVPQPEPESEPEEVQQIDVAASMQDLLKSIGI